MGGVTGAGTGSGSNPAITPAASLSSTTPDVRSTSGGLTASTTLGWGALLGLGVGALLLRSPGAGFGAGALATGALRGGLVGAGLGAALLGADRVSGGRVSRLVELASLDRRSQLSFVLSHPTKPWLAGLGLGVAKDARATQYARFGTEEPLDGPQDAFRHAYAAALFSLRTMRDHGASPDEAHELALEAGDAHEADGQDSNDAASRAMDEANNLAGTRIVGDGRAAPGEPADADGWLTDEALEARVLTALASGGLQVVDRRGDAAVARATSPFDLPDPTR